MMAITAFITRCPRHFKVFIFFSETAVPVDSEHWCRHCAVVSCQWSPGVRSRYFIAPAAKEKSGKKMRCYVTGSMYH